VSSILFTTDLTDASQRAHFSGELIGGLAVVAVGLVVYRLSPALEGSCSAPSEPRGADSPMEPLVGEGSRANPIDS
jgi:hypothetical protein